MNYKTGTYRTTTELITALRSFMVTDCSLTERAFGVDGAGYKLLVSDANAQYNFRTALNESVVDVQDGNLTGLAMNFSTAYDATKAWNLQTNYTRYLHSTPPLNSCAVFSTITAGSYYFFENSGEYAIILKDANGVYQQMCFGKLSGTGTNTWIYATGTISGYLANYSTNNKYMLFSDSVLNTVYYGSLFMYNLTTGIQYSDYDSSNKIEAPIDDVTASTMNKFLSDLWEKGENQLCRIPPLLKLYFFLMSGTDRKYIGYSNLIRLINLENTDAETEFVLGEDRFKAFPLNSMNDTYFYRGIAVKK